MLFSTSFASRIACNLAARSRENGKHVPDSADPIKTKLQLRTRARRRESKSSVDALERLLNFVLGLGRGTAESYALTVPKRFLKTQKQWKAGSVAALKVFSGGKALVHFHRQVARRFRG